MTDARREWSWKKHRQETLLHAKKEKYSIRTFTDKNREEYQMTSFKNECLPLRDALSPSDDLLENTST